MALVCQTIAGVNAGTLSTSIDFGESSSNLNTPSLADCIKHRSKNVDYRNFKFQMYVREYPWLYYNPVERGYKCKYCELFPAMRSGNKKHKFGKEAVKSLTDYPHHISETHKCLSKHQKSVKEYQCNEVILIPLLPIEIEFLFNKYFNSYSIFVFGCLLSTGLYGNNEMLINDYLIRTRQYTDLLTFTIQ